jgi:hypothetical protein
LQDAVEQTCPAVRVEDLLLICFNVIPTKVIGKCQEEGFYGKGRDELVEIPSSMRFCVREAREIKRGSVTWGWSRTYEKAAAPLRVFQIAQECRSTFDIDCLATKKWILVPPDIRQVKIEWPVPRGVDTDRKNLVEIGDKRGGNQLRHLDIRALLDLYFDREVNDFLRVDIPRDKTPWFDCQHPQMAQGLQIRFVIGGYGRKAGEESGDQARYSRIWAS